MLLFYAYVSSGYCYSHYTDEKSERREGKYLNGAAHRAMLLKLYCTKASLGPCDSADSDSVGLVWGLRC